jgi:hypothetical protein
MKPAILLFTFAGLMGVTALRAQDSHQADPCGAMQTASSPDVRNFLTFDRFDNELRLAIAKQDALALAFLVKFPLTVNDASGSISLKDAATLKTHFQEVFSPAVRKAILDQPRKEQSCMPGGVMYGAGVVWVGASKRGYAVEVVNRDAVPPFPDNRNASKINFICQTQAHRIVVDTLAGGTLRYRAWDKPRPVTETPDLEISTGEGTFEGHSVCAYPVYTFKNGSTVYQIEGALGCWGDNEPGPPKGATGRLEVTIEGKAADQWCY